MLWFRIRSVVLTASLTALCVAALAPAQTASSFAPTVRSKVDPAYTAEARTAHVEGVVLLYAVIGTDGRAHDIKVIRPLGHGLDEKAMECLGKWRFYPATKNDAAVATPASAEIQFHLNP